MRNVVSVIAVLTLSCSALFVPVAAGYSEETTAPDPVSQYGVGCLWEGCIGGSAAVLGAGIMLAGTSSSYSQGPFGLQWTSFSTGGLVIAVGLTVGAAGLAVGPAVGVYRQGRRAGETGSFWTASAGSLGGLVAGGLVGLAAFGVSGQNWTAAVGSGVTVGLLAAPAGAVIGYNLSRPKPDRRSSFEGRLELPSLAVRQERLADKSGLTVYDAKLVTVRF